MKEVNGRHVHGAYREFSVFWEGVERSVPPTKVT